MSVQTTCPACGAPLEYAGEQDVVVCGFCNTEIQVVQDGEGPRFQVLSQPEPQKEVLSRPVNPIIEGDMSGDALSGEVPADFTTETFGLGTSSQEPFTPPPPVSSPPFEGTITSGGAQVFTPGEPARSSFGGLPKWAVIVIAVVAGLCLLCACAVGASIMIFRSASGGM